MPNKLPGGFLPFSQQIDYPHLLWTTLSEFPGTILGLCIVERFGRKRTLALMAFVYTVAVLTILGCKAGARRKLLVAALFVARGFALGFFQTLYVYTPGAVRTNLTLTLPRCRRLPIFEFQRLTQLGFVPLRWGLALPSLASAP